MASGESAVVLLKSQADWPRWLAVIQTKANHNSVWDYIKPTLEREEIRPELHKPSPPVVATFSATPNATLQSLDSEQLKRYEMAYRVYKDELKDWERRQTTINDIDDYIMRTTGAYWSTIERVQGVKERLQRLKEHVAPSNYAREQEVLARYESVRKSAKATQTDEWLRQWESTLSDLKERKLPEAEGIRPTRAFLQAVEPIQPLFTQTWINTIESTAVMHPSEDLTTKVPDGFQIAQIFRNQANVITRDATAAFSTATLQGKEAESYGKTDQRCFEGFGHHTLDRCYYLRKDLRPEGWTMRIGAVKQMLEGLKKSPDLLERHQETIKEMEDFLDESKKEDALKESPAAQSKSIIGEA
jgi:hypothetical protein